MLAVDKLLTNYKEAIFDNKQLLNELEANYQNNIISIKEFKLQKINIVSANKAFRNNIKYLNQYMVFCKCKKERFKK